MTGRQAGVTVVEALVSLLLGLGLVQASLAVGARVRVAHAELLGRAEVLASARLTGALLRSETGVALRGRDWELHDDALRLRAFRGTALVCPEGSGADTLDAAYVGYRAPDPTKDSVVVLYQDGSRVVRGLEGVGSGVAECMGEALSRRTTLVLSESVPTGAVVARVFERGAYSVADAAFRYRRGAAGRQPLTPEVWDRSSGWVVEDGRVAVELLSAPDGTGTSPSRWHLSVAWSPRR
ncbi:MAG: hypothetical protein U5R14_04335 [Gemmatimonadota bacterium]|nr:hypothetical protein [Gemmatimonadota bacterium]